jgi:hypothetical protein
LENKTCFNVGIFDTIYCKYIPATPKNKLDEKLYFFALQSFLKSFIGQTSTLGVLF